MARRSAWNKVKLEDSLYNCDLTHDSHTLQSIIVEQLKSNEAFLEDYENIEIDSYEDVLAADIDIYKYIDVEHVMDLFAIKEDLGNDSWSAFLKNDDYFDQKGYLSEEGVSYFKSERDEQESSEYEL